MKKPVLEVRNLVKRFDSEVVVKDVSFEIYDGEFLFLIGPSGCGKTTTLRMIGGYETPDEGQIVLRGRTINDVPLEKRNIGMVFQSYALFPHMTVEENIAFGLRMRGMAKPERKERIASVLALTELDGLAKRYPRQLSGGQRQRVAIARVIVYEPDILLLDEPLANLDKRLRDAMRVELKKLQERVGITTLYVTHDQEEALSMADRIAVMERGNLLQIGPPHEVYNQPRTSFVAAFLGAASSLDGAVAALDGGMAQVEVAGGLRIAIAHDGDLRPGGQVLVSLRPERVQIAASRPEQGQNVFAGKVNFVSYLGSHMHYTVQLDGAPAQIRASEALTAGKPSFQAGARVYVSWDPGQAAYLKA